MASPALPLPPGFSVLEELDEDPVATAHLLGDGVGGEAVLIVARSAVSTAVRADYRRWAAALLTVADGAAIARVLAADVTPDGRPFLVVESGTVLGDRLDEDGPLPVATAVAHGRVLADALVRAHAAGIPHGTVQPATVLVGAEDHAVLAGFGSVAPGLAVATSADAYTAPELLPDAHVGRAVATAAGDVYQLGITLYVALGGEPAWQGTPLDLSARATPLAETPAVRGALLDLLRAMTLTDPGARPSAEQVRDWLATVDPDGTREDRAIPRELLAGRGVRKVGRRTTALASIAGGAAGVAVGTAALKSASTATAPTAAATAPVATTPVAAVPVVAAPGAVAATAATTTGAAITTAAAASVSVTKVVVITVVSVVVGVGGVAGVNEVLGDEPCDSVVADRPLETVLVGSAEYLRSSAYSFHLRYFDDVDAEGSVDAVARTASVELKPPGSYVGKIRLAGDDVSLSGPIAGTSDGEWTHGRASSNPVAQTVLAIPDTVTTMLGSAQAVERDGCYFTGRLVAGEEPLDFRVTVEDGTGNLRRFVVATGERASSIDLEVTWTGPGSALQSTAVTPPPRADLTGRWVDGSRALLINGVEASVMKGDEGTCTGKVLSTGTSVDIAFTCLPGYYPVDTVTVRVELSGGDKVVVTGSGRDGFDGTYQFAGG